MEGSIPIPVEVVLVAIKIDFLPFLDQSYQE